MMVEDGFDQLPGEVFAGLPFELPRTSAAGAWLDELDYVDVYTGSLDELAALIKRAPSESAAQWLRGVIDARRGIALYQAEPIQLNT